MPFNNKNNGGTSCLSVSSLGSDHLCGEQSLIRRRGRHARAIASFLTFAILALPATSETVVAQVLLLNCNGPDFDSDCSLAEMYAGGQIRFPDDNLSVYFPFALPFMDDFATDFSQVRVIPLLGPPGIRIQPAPNAWAIRGNGEIFSNIKGLAELRLLAGSINGVDVIPIDQLAYKFEATTSYPLDVGNVDCDNSFGGGGGYVDSTIGVSGHIIGQPSPTNFGSTDASSPQERVDFRNNQGETVQAAEGVKDFQGDLTYLRAVEIYNLTFTIRDCGSLPPIARVVGMPDISSNGIPEVGVLQTGGLNSATLSAIEIRFVDTSAAQAFSSNSSASSLPPQAKRLHIRDGSTDVLISDIDFGVDEVFDIAVLPDLNSTGNAEIALLNQQASGQVRVQIRDSKTGLGVKNLWYGMQYEPVKMAVVPDYSGNGDPEIAVLGSEAGTDGVRVQLRDSSTDSFVDNVFLGTQSIAKDLLSLTDTSGNGIPEMGILGVLKANNQVRMQVWDADTAAFQTNVWYGMVYQPHSAITMPDFNSNGSDEIAAVGVDPFTQNIRVQVRDSDSMATLYNIWLGAVNEAIDIALINDINSDGVGDLAVLLKTPDGTGRVRVQSGGTGSFIRNLFFSVVENPVGLAVLPDYSGNGFQELAVLGENAGVRHVQILDTKTGIQVNRIDFPSE